MHALRSLPLFRITLTERLVFAAALALVMLAAIAVDDILRRRDFRAAAVTLTVVLLLLAAGTLWIARNIVLLPAGYGRYCVFAELCFLTLAAALLGLEAALPPATNTFYGIEDPRGYEALTLAPFVATEVLWCGRYGGWFTYVSDLTRPFLSFLNVRFAIQASAIAVPQGWRALREDKGVRLLENERVIERVSVPERVALTDMSTADTIGRMWDARDFRSIAWIASRSAGGVRDNGPGRVSVRARRRGGEYLLDADMQRGGFVIVSETAWNGWRAWIDDRPTPVARANAASSRCTSRKAATASACSIGHIRS